MLIKLFTIISIFANVTSLTLKQVIVFSRHNIRTPFVSKIDEYTEKTFPKWPLPKGYLTEKGGIQEREMGKYFSDWLIGEGLLPSHCPCDDVFIYSNTKQRTKETAKAFAEGAFGDCVPVYFKNNTGVDPVFDLIVRNDTQEFMDTVFEELKKKIEKLSLLESYKELERILDFENSSSCQKNNVCELSQMMHRITYALNKEVDVTGPLEVAFLIVDSFLMAYYDGRKIDEVAWGQITTPEQWELLMTAFKAYHDVRFKTKVLSRDLANILLEYLTEIFLNGDKKFYLIVGHDANINLLMTVMNFKDYNLHDQLETTPIGGKIVFQRWYDEVNDQDLLRVNYVYRSTKQIRDSAVLSLENPPQWQLLEIENCNVDNDGFCPWDDFIKVLKSL